MRWRLALLFAVGAGLICGQARAASPAEVDAALAKAKKYLYSIQKDGHWEKVAKRVPDTKGQDITGSQFGGQTALAVLALIVAGDDPQDARLAPAIEFLKKADMIGTYALGIRAQVWLMLPQTPETRGLMKRDMDKLIGMMKHEGAGAGFYDYTGEGKSFSLSRSQYAVLGVWAAAQSGQEVGPNYWLSVEKAWTGGQEPDGGWRYQPKKATPAVTPGITAVGIATLFIVQDQLYSNRGVDCKNPMDMPAIEKGIDWMAKHFDQVASPTPYARDFPYATLYAVERVGVAGGLKYFGKHDWYAKGSDYIVKTQQKNGSFSGFPGGLPNTCFSMIFLTRGRAPVIINKLDWVADDKSAAGAWNRRPRDIANVTRWIGHSTERDLNWQIMSLDAPLADWHSAPILYLSGSDPLKIDKDHQKKMRQFAEEGGLILIHADCGRGGFVGSARNLASALFPAYEFRELPGDHPIYTNLYPRTKWKTKPSVMGVSNGVRELMLLIPSADPGKNWQIGVTRGREESWELAADIVFYAADQRDLRFKGQTHLVVEDPAIKTTTALTVARLKYKGNWDPEPAGWKRLHNIVHNSDKLDLTIQNVELGGGSLDGVKVAHLTGTTKVKLDDAARDQLKKFVAGGGTLVVDAAGGSEAFASSIEPELLSLGTGAKLEPLPLDHSLFGGAGAGAMKIAYRPFAQKILVGKTNIPRIKAVRVGDRPAILFSREDLSAGMVGHSVGGIVGYQPAVATELMRRIVLRAAGLAMPMPPAPATKPSRSTKPETIVKKPTSQPANAGDGLE